MGLGEPDERSKEFLLAEYRYFTDSLWRNEEGGEKRVQFFITLVTAVLAGLVAFIKPQSGEVRAEATYPMVAGALAALLVIGYVTLKRMRHRNRVTDGYKRTIDLIRSRFRDWDISLGEYQPLGTGCLARLPVQASREDIFRAGQAGRVAPSLVEVLHAQDISLSGTATIEPRGHGWVITDRDSLGLSHRHPPRREAVGPWEGFVRLWTVGDRGRVYLAWREQGQVKLFDGGHVRSARTGGLFEVVVTINSLIATVLLVATLWRVTVADADALGWRVTVLHAVVGGLAFVMAGRLQMWRLGRS
jgi:hypothetical protein